MPKRTRVQFSDARHDCPRRKRMRSKRLCGRKLCKSLAKLLDYVFPESVWKAFGEHVGGE